jgi:hypothetical protein
MLLSALGGLVVVAAALGVGSSCGKIENPKEYAELWALILESKLQTQSDFTPESWTPFAAALEHAERVAGSAAPTVETLRGAIDDLHAAFHALVRKPTPRSSPAVDVPAGGRSPSVGKAA